jgi:hypothetical protein
MTNYPCRGPKFPSHRDAHEAMERERHAAYGVRMLVDQPYAYLCIDGHWHVRMEWR